MGLVPMAAVPIRPQVAEARLELIMAVDAGVTEALGARLRHLYTLYTGLKLNQNPQQECLFLDVMERTLTGGLTPIQIETAFYGEYAHGASTDDWEEDGEALEEMTA